MARIDEPLVLNSEDYPSGSKLAASKANDISDGGKKYHAVSRSTSGKKPKSFMKGFFNMDLGDAVSQAVEKVLIPACGKCLKLFFNAIVNNILPGGNVSSKTSSSDLDSAYLDYGSFSNSNRPFHGREKVVDDIYSDDRDELLDLLRTLKARIRSGKSVSVGHLYEMIEEKTDPSDFNWGWDDLSNASITAGNGGWWLELPRAIRL